MIPGLSRMSGSNRGLLSYISAVLVENKEGNIFTGPDTAFPRFTNPQALAGAAGIRFINNFA